jgi:hypothetical protein
MESGKGCGFFEIDSRKAEFITNDEGGNEGEGEN